MWKYGVGLLLTICLGMAGFYVYERAYKSYTWHQSADKQDRDYDVIIVGSGFGGLSCGAYLSHCGYKVLLLEKNDFLGGVCSSYDIEGYRFCYGAEDILGLENEGSVNYLLKTLQLSKEDFFTPNSRRLVDGNGFIDIPSESGAFESVLMKKFPKDVDSIKNFLLYARQVFEEGYDKDMMGKWGTIIPRELQADVMGKEWISSYEKTHEHFLLWQKKTYQEVLDEYFTNSQIKLLFSGLVSYLGKTPVEAKASEIVLSSFGSIFYAGYHALKTPAHFAQALADYISSHNGAVVKNAKVTQIEFTDNVVQGVQVGDMYYKAPIVVANINVRYLFSRLVPRSVFQRTYAHELNEAQYSRSALCLHVAVEDPLTAYPTLIQDRQNKTFISIPSKNDPSIAPQDCSTVVARQLVNLVDYVGKTGSEYESYVITSAGMLLSKAIELVPELKNKGTVVKVISPLTYETLANIPSGAIFGFDIENKAKRPYFKTPFPGLYLASASCMGSGVQTVIANGLLCAHDIMDWKE